MRRTTVLVAVLSAAIAAGTAEAAGNADAGRALARQWCSGCHVVAGNSQGHDAAPTFAEIARRHASDSSWLRAWLAAPHPPMPSLDLSRQQTEDIVAYLDSLAKR